jgi:predicted permease
MKWHGWKWTVARLIGLARADEDLEEEIRAHLALDTLRRIEAGESPEAARLNAAREFGNAALVKETTRSLWTFPCLERLWQDARYAARSLRRSPGFTALAIAALALGIGATTAVFTVLYSVVIRPLPFPDPERLVGIWEIRPRSAERNVVSLLNFKAWKERARSFESIAAYNEGHTNLLGGDEPVQVVAANVTAEFFRVLRVDPFRGRGFAPGEDGPSASPLVLLSHGLWQRRFGGDPGVVGRHVSIGGTHHQIAGVLPSDFTFPGRRVELYRNIRSEYSGRDFQVIARLRPGVTPDAAQAEMTGIAAVTAADLPAMNAGWSAAVTPLHDQTVGRTRPLLRLLFVTVLFVLLIACANVANLLLMRALGRNRELSVRRALGAGGWRIAHQLTVETLLLTGAGGLLGTALANWGLHALLATLPDGFPLPRVDEITADANVRWFASGLCVTIGFLFGLVPVFLGAGGDLSESLRHGSRSTAPRQRRFRQVMVGTEFAVALVLVVGAGLMIRSFMRVHQVALGFQPERVLTIQMSLLPGRPPSHVQVVDEMLQRVRALPAVVSASSISILPMAGINSGTWYYRADLPEPALASRPGGDISIVMPGYFRTLGIPFLMGRDFGAQDHLGGTHAGIVNRTAARMLFGAEDPIGKRLKVSWNNAGKVEIVGVVADVRHRNPQTKPDPCLFLPHTQLPFPLVSLVIRTSSHPRSLIAAVKAELHQVDPDQGVAEVQTMEERVAGAGAQPRLQAWLVTAFSVIALALACIGIYGVISYTVSQRTREIGVRVALGADRLAIFAQILRESMSVAAAGVAAGLIVSLALARYLETLLFEVKPVDAGVYAAVAAIMLSVAAAASYFPCRRASRVDPTVTLRAE